MPKKSVETDLTTYFYEGKYKEVLLHTGAKPVSFDHTNFETLTALQVGALTFVGDLAEAQSIYEIGMNHQDLTSRFHFSCRFYLGVGCVRRSAYSQAASYFAANALEYKNKILHNGLNAHSEEIFYTFQGRAFFSFFRGNFNKTKPLAEKAYEAAFKSDFVYGQILALDLLGHSNCQLGNIRRGIFELEKAANLAQKIGNGSILTALQTSLVKYKAQFGINIQQSIQNLETAIQALDAQDTYSKAELYLELIRQLVLRGRGREAQQKLEAAGEIVYKHNNKRQSGIYNLRYAHLLFLRGESHAALALVRSLRSNLDKRVDISIFCQAAGLEQNILQYQNKESYLFAIPESSANFIDKRIHLRNIKKTSETSNKGEDPLGDLLDLARLEESSIYTEVKEIGLLGIIPKMLGIPPGCSGIFLGPGRSDMILVKGADVTCVDQGLTGPMKKLILHLHGESFKSKEYLISQTWGYQYESEIHDKLLHATIGKIRKLLSTFSYWLEWSNEGYRLSPDVHIFYPNAPAAHSILATNFFSVNAEAQREATNNNQKNVSSQTSDELNFRQLKILKRLRPDNFIGVSQFAAIYKISTMTACRDLSYLQKKGFLVRIGKGRATVYKLK